MGSGKTTVGRALADRLGHTFLDLDEQITRIEGRTIAEIFDTSGEAVFRKMEREALKRVVAHRSAVVATGGGVFDDPDNRRVIADASGWSVFLDTSWSTLLDRLGHQDGQRPLWTSPEQARALYERRLGSYRLADATVSISAQTTVPDIVEAIVRRRAEARCAT